MLDHSNLGTGGTASVMVGQYLPVSGVKSGTLIVRSNWIDVLNLSSSIDIYVKAAFRDQAGELWVDDYPPTYLAHIPLNSTANTSNEILIRKDFTGIPTPGLLVFVNFTQQGASGAALKMSLAVALELLPT